MTDFPFGFGLPSGGRGPDPNDPAQLAAIFAQLSQMLSSPDAGGPVNWDLATQLATGQARAGDRSLTAAERAEVTEALRLADLWLDPTTSLPSGVQSAEAWSRIEWITATLPTWRQLCDPVAARMGDVMGTLLPPEAAAQLGPMAGMLGGLGGMVFGAQVGQGMATLCTEVLTSTDVGLQLGPAGTAALLPANLADFGAGLGVPAHEVRLYAALREAAHHRLYGHVGWLRGYLMEAVDAYARGIHVDRSAVEDVMGRFDPANPEGIQEALQGGLFTPEDTPEQRAALVRLETALALVEGWVTHVVGRAADGRLPGAGSLGEAFRRRRAAGGPAEQTFATLVGLELRPRRLREAAALWAAVAEQRGDEGRDAVWSHPDLLPSADDLDDPERFARSGSALEGLSIPDDLSELDGPGEPGPDGPGPGGPGPGSTH